MSKQTILEKMKADDLWVKADDLWVKADDLEGSKQTILWAKTHDPT